jgi:hypothetical protein
MVVSRARYQAERVNAVDLHQPSLHWLTVQGVPTECVRRFFAEPAVRCAREVDSFLRATAARGARWPQAWPVPHMDVVMDARRVPVWS